jgi:uncharacterized repeat protein (TIGR01451 family)
VARAIQRVGRRNIVMGLIEDLDAAINAYPGDEITISVTSVDPEPHINIGEAIGFDVEVRNNGVLDMRNVVLHVNGTSYASVTMTNFLGSPFDFRDYVFSTARDILAHQTTTFGRFWMRADTVTPDVTSSYDLFTIHISRFDADLDHLLRDHLHHSSSPTHAYRRHIHPD